MADSSSPDAGVAAFFERFVAAFASFDGRRVAALYHVPHVALRGDRSIDCLTDADAVAGFFHGALDDYRAAGCRSCRYGDLETVRLGAASLLATVTWRLLDGQREVRRTWRQSYNLANVSGEWQVMASTEHVGWRASP